MPLGMAPVTPSRVRARKARADVYICGLRVAVIGEANTESRSLPIDCVATRRLCLGHLRHTIGGADGRCPGVWCLA